MSKFTPGPWRVEDDGRERLEITCAARKDRVAMAFVEVGFDEPFESEQEANARLIAAAPALFEVVERFCYALAASGVEPVKDSNDPVESLFHQAAELRIQIVGGVDDPCDGCNKAPVDCPGWVPGLSDAEQPCRQG